ncbi:hypothetical protein FACS1894133_4010 [Clostridia bacterium]|nr:hypothetical protein FACS1894133_4010 [Clostridia bacterium]
MITLTTNRTEQNRTEQNRTEQNRTEQNRTGSNYTRWGSFSFCKKYDNIKAAYAFVRCHGFLL